MMAIPFPHPLPFSPTSLVLLLLSHRMKEWKDKATFFAFIHYKSEVIVKADLMFSWPLQTRLQFNAKSTEGGIRNQCKSRESICP